MLVSIFFWEIIAYAWLCHGYDEDQQLKDKKQASLYLLIF